MFVSCYENYGIDAFGVDLTYLAKKYTVLFAVPFMLPLWPGGEESTVRNSVFITVKITLMRSKNRRF